MTQATPYERIGGEAGVRKLVHRFYELMDELPEAYQVRRLHPESLDNSEQNLFEYLSGWFGGPTMYTDKKGHPRMRQRHAPYAVSPSAKDEWMLCMKQSLAENIADETFRQQLQANFQALADHMVNTQ
ncbi:MAG TPA: group II truncated hemoglobin [Burkholderiaceae bacterium]|nr:group II truncated hemoglobin [Burkholderiaceae bacterium]